jgi:hypothetical protein
MYENWSEIEDFPDYSVSDEGFVRSNRTGRYLASGRTMQGAPVINLRLDGKVYNRSIKVLVAKAFVDGRSEIFNTPINLNGDQTDNRASNLTWRPRWFATKYTKQFNMPTQAYVHSRRVEDITNGNKYKCIWDVGIKNGLLFVDVWYSCMSGPDHKPVFPTWQSFRFIK